MPPSPPFKEEDVERVAKAMFEEEHPGLKGHYAWGESKLEDDYPGLQKRLLHRAKLLISPIPPGMVLVSEKLVEAARDAAIEADDECDDPECQAQLCVLKREVAAHDAAAAEKPCHVCGGKGTTPAPAIALYLPPPQRRELDQAAEDNPVTCWHCNGTGKETVATEKQKGV